MKKIIVWIFITLVILSTLGISQPFNIDKLKKGSVPCDVSPFNYTYEYIDSNIGDKIMVGDEEYTIVAIPFVEYKTGDHYYIKLPNRNKNNYSNFIRLNVYPLLNSDISCYPDLFSGFPSDYGEGISYSTEYRKFDPRSMGSTNPINKFYVEQIVTFSLNIKINQSKLMFYYRLTKENQTEVMEEDDIDGRDNIDTSKVNINTGLVNNVKILLNYVEIKKCLNKRRNNTLLLYI